MELHTIGIDLGKTSFHLVGLNERGEVVVRKQFSRAQLLRFTANLRVQLNRHGSLRRFPFSGPRTARAGARGAADPGPVREAVCEDQQE